MGCWGPKVVFQIKRIPYQQKGGMSKTPQYKEWASTPAPFGPGIASVGDVVSYRNWGERGVCKPWDLFIEGLGFFSSSKNGGS